MTTPKKQKKSKKSKINDGRNSERAAELLALVKQGEAARKELCRILEEWFHA